MRNSKDRIVRTLLLLSAGIQCSCGLSPVLPSTRRSVFRDICFRHLLTGGGCLTLGWLSQAQPALGMEWQWDDKPKGGFPVLINGATSQVDGAFVRLSYDDRLLLPTKDKIVVYQRTGSADEKRLIIADQLGIPRTLDIGDRIGASLSDMKTSRVIATAGGGANRVYQVGGQNYYTFDLESTTLPDTCYLVSTTVVRERLYVLVAQGDSADKPRLNRLRRSFLVTPL